MSFVINKKLARWVAAGFFATAGQMAFAASTETPADTDITNTASVSYFVNSVLQPVATGTRVFKVDNKVDLTVTGGTTNVVANASDQVITFTVTNTGNETQGYALDIEANGGDDFDANNVRIYVEDGTTAGFQIGEDTLYTAGSGVNIGDLDPFSGTGGDTINVYVVSDIPTTGGGTAPTDGQTAEYNLIATTLVAGSTTVQTENSGSADTFNAVDVVFADETGGVAGPHSNDTVEDGEASATGIYLVSSAQLSVTKTSAVISDPVNGATNPKAIPGATVRYTITVANGAGAAASATGVTLVDSIPTNTTYTANSITLDAAAQTDADDSPGTDDSDFNVTNAGAVTVVIGTIAAGASNVVTFDVTID